jgi:hypothetical protein
VGGPGLAFETWVFRLNPIAGRNPGLKSETWATHSPAWDPAAGHTTPTLCLALTISHTVPCSGESNNKRMYHGSAVLGHPSVRYVGYSQ